MATTQRWNEAQEYEKAFWADQSSQIVSGSISQFDWYRWRAEDLAKRLRRLGLGELADGNATVLEVGSGPVGILAFFNARQRISVDPLNGFYGSDPVLSALRSSDVSYRTGVGENIPCSTGSCDLVIIENCIDHVQDMVGVGKELKRVLRPNGILYLTVNCRSSIGYYVHRAMSRSGIDRGHPHTFTPNRALDFIERQGFDVLHHETGSPWAAHVADLRGPGLRTRLKALSLVSEYLITIVARARPAHA